VEILKNRNCKTKVLEIGTGSGIISIMLALLIKDIEIIAVDINEKALNLAKKNAKKHKVSDKIDFRLSNLYENVEEEDIFMTISNPPYIANSYKLPKNVQYEPKNALFGGESGEELLKKIIEKSYEKGITYLLCEIGYDQKEALEKYFKELNIKEYSFYKDYEKFDRGFTVKYK
jgi:release factor glutamine methyltransferase